MQPLTLALRNEAETQQLGLALAEVLPLGTVVLLYGDLGSGKTTLVQGIGQGLHISEAVISPTFVLVNEYLEGRSPLYHFDLYRLTPEEVDALHLNLYWDGSESPPGIVAIEWAERLKTQPADALQITLLLTDSGARQAQILASERVQDALMEALDRLSKLDV